MAGPTSPGTAGPTQAPPPLPSGWIAQWDGQTRQYYFVQLATGISQWETPTEAALVGGGGDTPAPGGEHPYGAPPPQLITHPKPINLDEWGYRCGNYESYPAYAWILQEMFRNSDLYQMAAQTFATSLLTRDTPHPALTANGLVFKIYRDHFGSIPVAVTGNSPQPKPTEPFGGEQPAVNAGSDTFPVDVVAAWTSDRRTLTIAVLNPTDMEQPLQLDLAGADLAGAGTLWRLASTRADAKEPTITASPIAAVPAALTLPRFSISIYEFPVK